MREPMSHQIKALEWAANRTRCPFFMEMRLGKTLVAIRWMQSCLAAIKQPKVLVLGPLSVLSGWEDELREEGITPTWLRGPSADKRIDLAVTGDASQVWHLLNYEGLRATPELGQLPWDGVILDESTAIRNPQAQTSALVLSSFANTKYRAILSGLPAPEGPLDYFQQMRFLFGEFMGCKNWWSFRHKWYKPGFTTWDWIPKPGAILSIRNAVWSNAFVLTRTEAGIGSRKVREKRMVELPARARKIYDRIETEWAVSPDCQTQWRVVVQTWLAQVTGGYSPENQLLHDAKFRELELLLTGELKEEPVVVWFRYNRELFGVESRLQEAGISCITYTGALSVDKGERAEAMRLFRTGKVRVLLAQVKCARFGLDCSAASTAIYYSNTYSLEDRRQSEDRMVHPKKRDPLLYIDLLAWDTVDEDVYAALLDKNVTAQIFMHKVIENTMARLERKRSRGQTTVN